MFIRKFVVLKKYLHIFQSTGWPDAWKYCHLIRREIAICVIISHAPGENSELESYLF